VTVTYSSSVTVTHGSSVTVTYSSSVTVTHGSSVRDRSFPRLLCPGEGAVLKGLCMCVYALTQGQRC